MRRGLDNVAAVLGALADPTRLRLLDVLVEEGQATATKLARRVPVSRQAIVKHLQVLEGSGLVSPARAGRAVLYRVRADPLDASALWLADLAAAWDRRLSTIKRAAEGSGGPIKA